MKKTKIRSENELKNFSLGQNATQYPASYAPEVLEVFDNKNPTEIKTPDWNRGKIK